VCTHVFLRSRVPFQARIYLTPPISTHPVPLSRENS
jgi:hypothetical protein